MPGSGNPKLISGYQPTCPVWLWSRSCARWKQTCGLEGHAVPKVTTVNHPWKGNSELSAPHARLQPRQGIRIGADSVLVGPFNAYLIIVRKAAPSLPLCRGKGQKWDTQRMLNNTDSLSRASCAAPPPQPWYSFLFDIISYFLFSFVFKMVLPQEWITKKSGPDGSTCNFPQRSEEHFSMFQLEFGFVSVSVLHTRWR